MDATGQRPFNAGVILAIALLVFLFEEVVGVFFFNYEREMIIANHFTPAEISVVFTHILLPVAIVVWIEGRGCQSLGLSVPPRVRWRYALYAALGLLAPAVFLGFDRALLYEFIDQAVYIGLPEEVFFRGYLMTRLCEWRGKRWGLVSNAFLFGAAHVISRLAQHGLAYSVRLAEVFLDAFLGGLLLGFLYLRAKNIVPAAILHISMNIYLSRLIGLY